MPIAEGDDLGILADNFAKTYGLNAEIRTKVLEILRRSLAQYRRTFRSVSAMSLSFRS